MTEEDAVVVREVGERPEFDFEPRDHLEIGTELGLIDMEAGARLSGSRFAYLKGDLVLLGAGPGPLRDRARPRPRGTSRWCRRSWSAKRRWRGPASCPATATRSTRSPRTSSSSPAPPRWRWPACTPARSSTPRALPLRYCGFSTCFRREAGAAGRDTRGIFRVHQFDKVEMFSFVEPSESAAEHERLLAIEERILAELEIPYRVVNVAAGDLGAPAAKKYDCEAWIPSQERYRELTSCSNTTDYQARRLGCRYRPAEGASPAGGAHAERHRGGRRAHDHRPDREPAGARRRIHATQNFA